MYKACIFDLDGTLLNTLDSISINANSALGKYGFKPHTSDEYKYFVGDGVVKLIERCLAASGDTELKMFNEVFTEYKRIFAEGCTLNVRPYDGITEMLDELKANGIKISVFSNKDYENVRTSLDTVFGKGYFDYMVGIREGVKTKPDRHGVDLCLNAMGVTEKECIYMGDTLTDMKTGKGAGLFTIGVTWGFRDEAELKKGNADKIIDRPEELIPIVLGQ